MKIIFDANLIKTIAFFEKATGAKVRDCIVGENDNMLFVVEENNLMRALGKNASNIKRLGDALKKKIRVVEYSPDVMRFIQNLIYPLRAKNMSEADGIITIEGPDTNTKGLIIGRNASNLRRTEKIVQRYFPIKEIKVI